MITPMQVRMARAALDWGVRKLAQEAALAPNTVSRFEKGAGARVGTLAQIQEALERAGVSVNRCGHGHLACKFPINVTVPGDGRATASGGIAMVRPFVG